MTSRHIKSSIISPIFSPLPQLVPVRKLWQPSELACAAFASANLPVSCSARNGCMSNGRAIPTVMNFWNSLKNVVGTRSALQLLCHSFNAISVEYVPHSLKFMVSFGSMGITQVKFVKEITVIHERRNKASLQTEKGWYSKSEMRDTLSWDESEAK